MIKYILTHAKENVKFVPILLSIAKKTVISKYYVPLQNAFICFMFHIKYMESKLVLCFDYIDKFEQFHGNKFLFYLNIIVMDLFTTLIRWVPNVKVHAT